MYFPGGPKMLKHGKQETCCVNLWSYLWGVNVILSPELSTGMEAGHTKKENRLKQHVLKYTYWIKTSRGISDNP